jgi:hypothetical protein
MRDIFVVMCAAGEWDEAREWAVRAFADETAAGVYAIDCDTHMKNRPLRGNYANYFEHETALKEWRTLGPDSHAPDGGDYFVQPLTFVE